MNADERLAVRISVIEKQQFKERAEVLGKTTSQLLLLLIRNYLNDDAIAADEYTERLLRLEKEVNALKQLEVEFINFKQRLEEIGALKSENAALKKWRDSILQVVLSNQVP
ncbi:hypothetical protein CAL7716_057950 [Calothrix sp. PCC 7716]|nr:hypothetical protein CAL7716_057950 [Calothrix sp. PCC 7716]